MSNINSAYRKAFEDNCFELLIYAYQKVMEERIFQLNWLENDISYELYEKIDDNPIRQEYEIHMSPEFRISKEVKKIRGFADKLPRIDLRVTSFRNKEEYKYFFEAKRLKEKDSALKRAYINEGMQRFISSKYPLGCMVGYLLEGSVDKTIDGINSLLVKDSRDSEILSKKPHEDINDYYESNHDVIIILKHIILDFTLST